MIIYILDYYQAGGRQYEGQELWQLDDHLGQYMMIYSIIMMPAAGSTRVRSCGK